MLVGTLILATALATRIRSISKVVLFWIAFVLTRPLGAVVGDFLDKSDAQGGLELSRYGGSLTLLVAIALCVFFFPQRPATKTH